MASAPHVAIIMDGNGRWAKARHRPRVFGHRAGVKAVRSTVENARELGIKCLTLYSFSTENWTRPRAEIAALFELLHKYIKDDLADLNEAGVRIRVIGSRAGLKPDILTAINLAERTTQNNDALLLNIAFNYGGRDELLRACRKAMENGMTPSELTEQSFEGLLDTAELPRVDLVIRTSGEYRISNFLLWQAAYAEFIFLDVLWPDFSKADLKAALDNYAGRERRFGAVAPADVA